MYPSLLFLSFFATIPLDEKPVSAREEQEVVCEQFIALSEEQILENEEFDEADLDLLEEENKEIAAVEDIGPTAAGFVAETNFGPDDDDGGFNQRVLRDFIESRGLIQCRQKEGKLTIAGDVRARWVTAGERVNHTRVRGTGTKVGLNQYRSEVNLFFDYETCTAWVSTKLRWSMFGGKDGGTTAKPEVDRAFIGYDVFDKGKQDFYVEVGRSRLDYMFESKIEFTASFTGIHFYYTNCYEKTGSLVIHGGPFVVDAFTNHYAWVAEANVKELGGTPFSVKYSIIDWRRHAPTKFFGNDKTLENLFVSTPIRRNPRYDFLVSQMIFGYQKEIDFFRCKTFYGYAAVLVNHAAKRRRTTNFRYLNHAWYTGFTLGKLCKACDWSVDLNYQWVQVQAVPEFDISGAGHGNASEQLFSDAFILDLPGDLARGFSNFKGPQLSLLFAMTDSLSLRAVAQYATPVNRDVGGPFFYKAFDLSVIYAF